MIFLGTSLFGQDEARITTAPAAFLGDEEITVYLRVLGTGLEEAAGPVYFESGANGGAMDKSLEATQSDDDKNVWFVTLTPDSYYGVPVETIEGKATDGAGIETVPVILSVFNPDDLDGIMTKYYPATPVYSENVSVVFNATMSDRDDLTGIDPIYMWAWNNPEDLGDAANQGEWGSIDPSAVCEKIGENLWRKDFVPQVYWDTEKPMTEFGYLFRNMAGDKQTEDLTVPLFAPPVKEVLTVIRTFPQKFTRADVVTIYYDLKLETNQAMKDQTEIYVETSTNMEEENNPLPGNWIVYSQQELNTARLAPLEDSVYFIQMIPDVYYSLDPDYDLKQLNFVFRNKGGIAKSETYSYNVLKED
jgi:hypothetical protein